MKRTLQSVALVLALILAAQPALAAMTCAPAICAAGSVTADGCLPANGSSMPAMVMHGMPGSSAMASKNASGGASTEATSLLMSAAVCASESCYTVSSPVTLQATAPVKFSVGSVVAMTPVAEFSPVVAPARPTLRSGDTVFLAQPRTILFHVFRL